MIRSHRLAALLLTAVVLTVAGCTSKTVYHHYEHTGTTGWEKDDTLFFRVPAMGQGSELSEEVELRTNSSYLFQDVSLIIKQTTFPSKVSRTDTLFCTLTDEEGNIQGKGVNYFQHRFHLTNFYANKGDSMVIAIRHNMRRDLLPGIMDVGVRLTMN